MECDRCHNIMPVVAANKERTHELRRAIRNFCVIADAQIITGETKVGELYPFYKQMEPCIHPYCGNERIVDINAFSYAMQRLPEEISRAREVFVKNSSEDLSQVTGIRPLKCKARRRTVYEKGEGYIHMIALEGETDVLDILTSSIIYGIEAAKMRKMLEGSSLADEVKPLSEEKESERKNVVLSQLADRFGVKYHELKQIDNDLDHRLFYTIANALKNPPEELVFRFDRQFAQTDASQKAREWSEHIAGEMDRYGERPVILISSNTHGVVNCLTGFARENRKEIQQLSELEDTVETSRVYWALQKLCKTNPDLLKRKWQYEEKYGVNFIRDRFDTGIDAQIIDLATIDPKMADPRLTISDQKPVILNIDYAFGKEGKYIMIELCEALRQRIQSISITGKAGIICGERYDIMLPTFLISQIEGGIYQFPNGNYLREEHVRPFYPDGGIHNGGPMLTVPGTAIQNRLVLQDYSFRYGVLGLEMEGIPYIDSIQKAGARTQKLLREDVMVQVGYWGSDNPLLLSQTLAQDHMDRGFEPTYAIILAMLNNALKK